MAFSYDGLRADATTYGIRSLQVLLGIVIVGVASYDASVFGPNDCKIPAKLAFNVAIVSIRNGECGSASSVR